MLQSRIYLPDGDPNKITDPSQIEEWYNQPDRSLSFKDMMALRAEVLDQQKHSPFGQDLEAARKIGHAMFSRSAVGSAMPDVAEAAWYNWQRALGEAIAAQRNSGKDPRELLDQSNKDSWLAPGKMNTFMMGAQAQVASMSATQRAQAKKGDVLEFKGKRFEFKGGDPAQQSNWKEVK